MSLMNVKLLFCFLVNTRLFQLHVGLHSCTRPIELGYPFRLFNETHLITSDTEFLWAEWLICKWLTVLSLSSQSPNLLRTSACPLSTSAFMKKHCKARASIRTVHTDKKLLWDRHRGRMVAVLVEFALFVSL